MSAALDERTLLAIIDRRIALATSRSETVDLIRGTVQSVVTDLRVALVLLDGGTTPLPAVYPALAVIPLAGDEVICQRRRADGLLVVDKVLGRDPVASSSQSAAPSYSAARAYRTTDQTGIDSGGVAISFDAERYDTDEFWVVGAPTRLTIPAAGTYRFGANVNGSNAIVYYIRLNGATHLASTKNAGGINSTSGEYAFAAGDYIELWAIADSGSLTANAMPNRSPEFWISAINGAVGPTGPAGDHGALTGLTDDDHTQYALDSDLATHAAAADPHTGYQKESEKAAASGYASLDAGTKVPIAQVPTGTTSATVALGDAAATAAATHAAAADPHTGYLLESLFTTRGDLVRRGAANVERVALGSIRKVLASDGTDAIWQYPVRQAAQGFDMLANQDVTVTTINILYPVGDGAGGWAQIAVTPDYVGQQFLCLINVVYHVASAGATNMRVRLYVDTDATPTSGEGPGTQLVALSIPASTTDVANSGAAIYTATGTSQVFLRLWATTTGVAKNVTVNGSSNMVCLPLPAAS